MRAVPFFVSRAVLSSGAGQFRATRHASCPLMNGVLPVRQCVPRPILRGNNIDPLSYSPLMRYNLASESPI